VSSAEATAAAERAQRRRFALAASCAMHWKRKALRTRRRLTADAASTVTAYNHLPRTWAAAAAAAAVPLHDCPSLHLLERPSGRYDGSAAPPDPAYPSKPTSVRKDINDLLASTPEVVG